MPLRSFVIYKNPSDYPNKFVVRKFLGENPEDEPVAVVDSLELARTYIPLNFVNLGRQEKDDPVIFEVWV